MGLITLLIGLLSGPVGWLGGCADQALAPTSTKWPCLYRYPGLDNMGYHCGPLRDVSGRLIGGLSGG